MKRDKRTQGEKSDQQKDMCCPLFKRYYTGICSGHKLPYAPTNEEKKKYCLTSGFRHCTIYGESSSTSES